MAKTPTMRLNDVTAAYLTGLIRRELSKDRIDAYRYMFRRLCRAFHGNPYMSQITATDMERFFYGGRIGTRDWPGLTVRADGKGTIGGATWNVYRALLVKFFSELHDSKVITDDVMTKVDEKGTEDSERLIWLTGEQIDDMLNRPELRARDVAMLAVAADYAPRAAELRRLRIRDYNINNDTLRFTLTKSRTRKTELVIRPLTPDCKARIHRWLVQYAQELDLTMPELLAKRDWYLFPRLRRTGDRYDAANKGVVGDRYIIEQNLPCAQPWDAVKKGLLAIGYTTEEVKTNGVHCIRRSAASAEVDASGDIRSATKLLNHKSQTTTETYLRRNRDQERLHERMKEGGWRAQVRPAGTVTPLHGVTETTKGYISGQA